MLGLDAQNFLMTANKEFYLPVYELLVDIIDLLLTAEEMEAVAEVRMKDLEDIPVEEPSAIRTIEGRLSFEIKQPTE